MFQLGAKCTQINHLGLGTLELGVGLQQIHLCGDSGSIAVPRQFHRFPVIDDGFIKAPLLGIQGTELHVVRGQFSLRAQLCRSKIGVARL